MTQQEFNREIAQATLARIAGQHAFANDQLAAMAKWLMASLLALNTAGAYAAVNTETTSLTAASFFIAGTVLALLSGVTMQDLYRNFPDRLVALQGYWIEVSLSGHRLSEREVEIAKSSWRQTLENIVPTALGWFSGVAWLAGAIILAVRA